MSEIWRSKQLEYSWTLTLAGHYARFLDADRNARSITRWRGCRRCRSRSSRSCSTPISSSMPSRMPAPLCARSRAKGHRTGILSNGSPDMLKARGRRRRDRRRSRRRAVGRCAENVQAAAGGLRASSPTISNASRASDVRVIQPLGRDGAGPRSVSAPVDQSRENAGRISGLPAGADAERPERAVHSVRLSS